MSRHLAAAMASNKIDSANQTHENRTSPYPNFSQEVWDKITEYLLPSSALSAGDVLNFKSNAYDRVWTAVFRNEGWLESCSAKVVNVVLTGADLDILSELTMNKAQPRLILAAFDCRGELQYENDLLHLSLRGCTPDSKEHQLERLTLAISRLNVPEVLGQDFCYLFSSREQQIQTKYCYWGDPEKKIRTLCSQDIRGIDGPITQIQNLRPIFLLNLPTIQTLHDSSEYSNSDPVQFTFRCFSGPSFWTGRPPLVDVVLSEGWEQSQLEYTFQGFTFKDERYKEYDLQCTDWISVAELESGQKSATIITL